MKNFVLVLCTLGVIGLLSGLGGCAQAKVGEGRPSVLVLGASGKLGSETVKALLERGKNVVAFVRPTSDLKRLDGLNVQYFVGDLTRDQDIRRIFKKFNVAAVIDASARRDNFDRSYYDALMSSIVMWGRPHGLRQVVLHSSVGVGQSAEIPTVASGLSSLTAEKKVLYADTMAEKTAAEEILKASGLEYTIIRNWLLEFEGTDPTGAASLTEDLTKLGRVTRPDLARLGAGCIENPQCINKTFNAIDETAQK